MAASGPHALGKDLATTPLANVLITALKQKATGELTLNRAMGVCRIYFRAGVPAGTQSTRSFRPLGRLLLDMGWISATHFEVSVTALEDGKRQGESLVAMGALAPQKLTLALQIQQLRNLIEIAQLEDGSLDFVENSAAPSWAADVPLNALRALREVLGVPQSAAVCQGLFQKVGEDALVVIPPHLVSTSSHFELDQPELSALRLLESPITIKQFLARCHLPAPQARALVAELIVTNLLVPPDQAVPKGAERLVHQIDEGSRERRRRMLDRAIASVGVGPFTRNGSGALPRASAPKSSRDRPALAAVDLSDELPPMADALAGVTGVNRANAPSHNLADVKLRALIEERAKLLPSLDLHGRLGLSSAATKDQVKSAFVQAVKIFHADRLPESLSDLAPQQRDIFAAIKEAYDILTDDEKTRAYKAQRAPAARPSRSPTGSIDVTAAGRARDEEARSLATAGELALKKRDYATAAESFRQANELAPRGDYAAGEAWATFSDPARKVDQKRARDLLEQARRSFPESEKVAQYLGVLARLDGKPDEAEIWLRKAIEINPRNLDATNELHLLTLRKRQR